MASDARQGVHETLEAAQEAIEIALRAVLEERYDLSCGILHGGQHLSDETRAMMIPPQYARLGLDLQRLCRQYTGIWEVINGG